MTEKRFVIKPSSIVTDGFVIIDKEKKYTFPVLDSTLNYMFCKALNELHEEKEYWKGTACNNSNFVNILLHELDIAQEKGYKVSDPFEKLMKREELIE